MKTVPEFKIVKVSEAEVENINADSPVKIALMWHDTIVKNPIFDEEKEFLVAFHLNTKYNVKGYDIISMGSLNESIAHPREIFRKAVINASHSIILAHNHPSGDPSPSDADIRLTRRIRECSELMMIKLLDHVIIGADKKFYSFREAGLV